MATKTREELIELFKNMSVLELSEFVKELKDALGLPDAMPMMAAPVAGGQAAAAAPAQEKSEFKVTLKEASDKIKAIRVVKEITGKSLGDAKKAVEEAPVVLAEAVPAEKAQEMKKKLEEAGAKVELS